MTSISADDPVTDANAGRDFWRRMLLAGSASRVPRWTLGRVAGQAERDIGIPLELSRRLERLGDELAVSLTSLWLAAHAKVLSALSGDGEVATGYSPEGRRGPLPCRLSTEASSWRALALKAHQVESELLAHKDFAVADLSRELRLVEAPFETVLDAAGEDDGELPEHVVLALSVCQDGGPRVRLRYRTDALDGACAARIAGYHLRALELMAAEPEADHARHSLVWADEREFQIHGLAGPRRELPDRRVHELFEAQVRGRPDALAAVHGDTQWTYGQLNARANRLARALQARGLEREGVVAVVAERNLNWLAAVLAIFKAGGAYLPIEPHFPPDRIAKTLSRSGCGLVVSEPGSTETLDQALLALPQATAPSRLLFDEAWPEDHPDGDLGMEVAPGQLAYIYFTSGSTGEPKGAMCEHAGMLNHLYAKIDDLQIAAGSVVAQTAPQCFDISLWQLLCALLVGGRTLLIEQDAIMDAERFIDKIVGGRVGVLQVVPSYLEVLMSYLEQRPRELPDLRYVSVTGEALKKELAQRWFAAQPAIKLVNAYGLTETSDDTNHEVMDKPPSGERVPLGRPVNNVHVYVVDQNLLPVPLGAPGEIVFSGVCVGRGYVNDRERTQRAFMADPHRAAERLYRSGDYGRWRPDGKLEFLGRRDAQVKISGFRIEIGEIENALIRVGGVRDGAVIVTERGDKSKQLVAFYCADAPLDGAVVRERLAESLPEYMVPATCHWRQTLPLTANSKVDKKALRALARELDEGAPDRDRPSTPTEHRVAAAWAKVLGLPQKDIGRHDHFFDSGGTSLAAVKLAIALDRAVSFKDLTGHPVLGELAALIDRRSRQSEGLLQLLSHAEGQRTTALICFPYAGGNAVNFQAMASALRDSGLAMYAVEPPGHDLAAEPEPFAPIEDVVGHVVAEVVQLGLRTVLLWGHSSGSALAVETARELEARGIAVERVFVAAQLLGRLEARREAIAELVRRSNAEIAQRLSTDNGYTELGELDAERGERVGAAYRHDFLCANRYLADILVDPPAWRLIAPVTVVVASDDPNTVPFAETYRDWRLVAQRVELQVIDEGGHYFLRTRPAEAADVVLRAVESLAAPDHRNGKES